MDYRRFSVSRRQKEPLLVFILSSLESCGCRILRYSGAGEAPFRIGFEAPDGERIGIIAYAFFAHSRVTRNRPADEHRFQVKYGPNTGELHELWQDPFGLYTTQTEHWELTFALTSELDPHDRCPGKLSNRARVDQRWDTDVIGVLERALAG